MSITSRPKNPTVGTVAKEAECPHSNAFGASWQFRCEPAPDRAGHCDRSRRHQPGGVRLDLLDADGEAYARAETVGSRKSHAEHSRYSCRLCADRTQGSEYLQHLAGCVPNRRRDDNRLYGIRHASRRPHGRPDTTYGRRCCRAESACSAHHVCCRTWDDHGYVTLAAVHTPEGLPVTAIVAAVVSAAITYSGLLVGIGVGSRLGGGTQAIVIRFMGLIVASMGMQFVLTGLKEFLSL